MAKTASKEQTAHTASTGDSKYYLVNRMNQLSQQLADLAHKCNDQLVTPSVAATRETIDQMRKDPKKALSQMKADGRERMQGLRSDLDSRIHDWMDDGKDLLKELAENPRAVVDDYFKDRRKRADHLFSDVIQVVGSLAKDGKTAVADIRAGQSPHIEDIVATGKKYFKRLPGVKSPPKAIWKNWPILSKS